MINKIEKIDNHGIFRNFTWKDTETDDFSKKNVFYGWNGSGKSTLANIFEDIGNKQIISNANVKIKTASGNSYDSSNIGSFTEKVFVYNENFKTKNLATFEHIEGIVYLAEENKEKKEKLIALTKQKLIEDKKHIELSELYSENSSAFDKLKSKIAKEIKEEFHVIGGLWNQKSNYTKTNFENAVSSFADFLETTISNEDVILKIDNCKKVLKEKIKNLIETKVNSFDCKTFRERIIKAKNILKTSIKEKVKLEVADDIFKWIEEGYKLTTSLTCNYCGSIITQKRNAQLKNIFNDEYKKLISGLSEALKEISETSCPQISLTDDQFYADKVANFKEQKKIIEQIVKKINSEVKLIVSKLNEKTKDPYSTVEYVQVIKEEELSLLEKSIVAINQNIDSNNKSTNEFSSLQQESVNELEKMFVYKYYKREGIKKLKENLFNATKKFNDKEVEIQIINEDIVFCKSQLRDVIKAADVFNNMLAKFIGRDEIELKFDDQTKGYKVLRKENGLSAKGLSEGEKSAIAFIYFMAKVFEKDNDITKTIIVIDDPISSLDANHIFNAYSFILAYFEKAEQLIILTHNYTFMSLFKRKLGNKNFYYIKNEFDTTTTPKKRYAKLINLPKSLKDSQSEYSFLFKVLYEFSNDNADVDLKELLSIANISRKVLETFSSFKSKISQFEHRLLTLFKFDDTKPEIKMRYEKIHKFTNYFSHDNNFDSSIGGLDLLLAEAHLIVKDILELIKENDEKHYNTQVHFCAN